MSLARLLLAVLMLAACASAWFQPTQHGVAFLAKDTLSGLQMVVEVGSNGTFRLGVRFGANSSVNALPSPSLDPNRTMSAFHRVAWGGMAGVATAYGALLASPTGNWIMYDASNQTLLSSAAPPTLSSAGFGTVRLTLTQEGAAKGTAEPCLGNGIFAPPFFWDRTDGALAFAVSPWEYDPEPPASRYVHCYPAGFVDAADKDTCTAAQRQANWDVQGGNHTDKHPAGLSNTTEDGCCAACNADPECIAWVWADPAKPDSSGANCWTMATVTGIRPNSGRVYGGDVPPRPPGPVPAGRTGWWIGGHDADWYLAPAPTGHSFSAALFSLTGAPAVPPRHALGFMATYWGYDTMQEVEGNMTRFRAEGYPIDSFIMDYDWFGPEPCGPAGAQGGLNCGDFGYKPNFFGNETFVDGNRTVSTHTPKELLAHFHNDLHMRWAGIRKPRSYSTVDKSNSSGWLLPDADTVGAGNNNWNFSIPAMRDWYTTNHLHFIDDGVDFWWNDEGETQWFTYLYWNMAQHEELARARPNHRQFSVNRAFQPGMQRYGASTWSGDAQNCGQEFALQFALAGQPYMACDMTSPDATVLVRQYQNAAFLPIMRVHQMHGTPRFPFLWCGPNAVGGGTAAHCAGFHRALRLRYAFLPHLYSLAHAAHRTGRLPARPADFNFEGWSAGADVYMVGDSLLPATVSTAHLPGLTDENTAVAHLPPGMWYSFNTTATVTGNQTLVHTDVPLADVVLYVREGAILVLQQDVVQYSDAMGGQLEVHVYAGRDSSFDLVEDDGETLDYAVAGTTRTTHWTYVQATRSLTWSAAGSYAGGSQSYTTVQVVYFESGKAVQRLPPKPLGGSGSVSF